MKNTAKARKFTIYPATAILFLLMTFVFTGSIAAKEAAYKSGELLVQLRSGTDIQQVTSTLKSAKLQSQKLLSARMNIWLVTFDEQQISGIAALKSVKQHPDVQNVQFNHFVTRRNTIPNDTQYTTQWALNNLGQTGGVVDADIDAPEAWDISTGGQTATGEDIVIAVIDGGVDLDHPDLNFWKNTGEIPGNSIDDDGNGYVDDVDGWNAYQSSGNIPNDDHGTHVAGIAAAIGNNGVGVSGVNWGASVLPVAGSSGQESVVIEAYGYVLEMRQRYNESGGTAGAFIVVTNASFGVDFGDPADFPLWCAIYDSLGSAGILNCGATANLGINVDNQGDVPTACPSPFMIAVTNTTHTDSKNNGAAFGQINIDLGAPGTGILSTLPFNSYGSLTGTSMATPAVAGAIALMYSAASAEIIQAYHDEPAEIALQFREFLLNGVDPIPALDGITATGGRLNVNNSLQLVQLFSLAGFSIVPGELSFGPVEIGFSDTLSLIIRNSTDSNTSFDILSDTTISDFYPLSNNLTVNANSRDTLQIVFSPSEPGEISALLTISNPDTVMTTPLSGSGLAYPVMAVDSSSMTIFAKPGETVSRNLAIANQNIPGGEALRWTAFEMPLPASAGSKHQKPQPRQSFAERNGNNPVTVNRARRAQKIGDPRVIFFEDDMENGINNWTTEILDGASDDLWHRSESASNSPVTSWWCADEIAGNYNTGNRIKTALVSPTIDLTSAVAPVTLSFYETYNTEEGWDFCMVDLSIDGGLTWQTVRDGLSGNSGGWLESAVDLSAFAGETVQFRYHFDSTDDFSNDFPGWRVDDVRISDSNVDVYSWLQINPFTGVLQPEATENIAIEIDANGLVAGTYPAQIRITGNDPDVPEVTIPVELVISEIAIFDVAVNLNFTNGVSFDTLKFGTASDASDFFDTAYDLYAPPQPPGGAFDARFRTPTDDLRRDFRKTNLQGDTIVWRMRFSPGSNGLMTVSWQPGDLPKSGSFRMKDVTGGQLLDLDMRLKSEFTDNLSIGQYYVEYIADGSSAHAALSADGWNLVSLPLAAPDPNYQQLFPNATPGSLYGYDGVYVTGDSLAIGVGYWLNFANRDTAAISGSLIDTATLHLQKGWNLIGGISHDIPLNEIADPAAVIVPGTLYGFNGVYGASDVIRQGRGYWINAVDSGEIFLQAPSAKLGKSIVPPKTMSGDALSKAAKLQVQSGNVSQTLYFNATIDDRIDRRSFSLPPLAPVGFDARFAGDVFAVTTAEATIRLQNNGNPVTVTPENLPLANGDSFILEELLGTAVVATHSLQNGQPLQISSRAVTQLALRKVTATLPTAFAVEQNYPNPFNPATEIRFALPGASDVEITIYNALGQKVNTLVNRKFDAGFHSVKWNGTDERGSGVSSGIYFYRVSAGAFSSVKKMLLVK